MPGLPGLLRATRLGAGLTPLVTLGALALGLLSNALGPERRIAILQWPLVGLVLWNLLMYGLFLAHARKARAGTTRGRPQPEDEEARGAGLASRVLEGTLQRFTNRARRRHAEDGVIVSAALSRYAGSWRRTVMPLLAARARLMLHLGSLALALGLVAGMYVRGLAFRYEATWESTFLDASGLRSLVGVILGPAAALTGRTIPSVADLVAMQGPKGSGPAAPWIHLYAVTALLFVVGPRLLFALVELRAVGRLSANLPVDVGATYAARAGAGGALAGAAVALQPYGFQPSPRVFDGAKGLLFDVFGTGVEIPVLPTIAYGAEVGDSAASSVPGPGPSVRVVLVSIAQTPETEVHGRFLREARAALPAAGRLVLVADASAYRERVADAGRVQERRRAWDRVAHEAEVAIVHADFGTASGDAPAQALRAAVAREAGAAGGAA